MNKEVYEQTIKQLTDFKNEKLQKPEESYLHLDYSREFVEYIYEENVVKREFSPQGLRKLDFANYLENYLLHFYTNLRAKESLTLTKSIILLINYKFQENVNFWEHFNTTDLRDKFKVLFENITSLSLGELNYIEKIEFHIFLVNIFRSYEEDFINETCLKYVSYGLWKNLSSTFLKNVFLKYPNLLKAYKKNVLNKSFDHRQTEFLVDCIAHFWSCLQKQDKMLEENENVENKSKSYSDDQVKYFEKFLELLIDLLNQIPTRGHVRFLLQDQSFIVKCKLTKLFQSEQGTLFKKLVEMLEATQDYALHEESGTVMSDATITLLHYDKMSELQNILFKNFKERYASSLVKTISSIDSKKPLIETFSYLSDQELVLVCQKLNISLPEAKDFAEATYFQAGLSYNDLVIEILLDYLLKKKQPLEILNNTSHYPNEKTLWDKHLIPDDMYYGRKTLPLPKLNLQFLSLEDYLIRNYNLFRLEAAYEIRADIEDAVTRVHASFDANTGNFASFNGWARMAAEIKEFTVHEVEPPKIGESYSSNIFAEVKYSTQGMNSYIRKEWQELRQHDVVFLISFKKNENAIEGKKEEDLTFFEKYGVQYVRGAEIVSHMDEDRNEITKFENSKSAKPEGNIRYLQILLDSVQYKQDLETLGEKDNEVYGSLHLLVRRKQKENNFKAILTTIKDVLNTEVKIPEWLEDILLGYGNLKSEEYLEFKNKNFNPSKVNYFDTFLDQTHYDETFINNSNIPAHDKTVPIPKSLSSGGSSINTRKNQIRFTTKQVEAIYSGLNESLTVIEGPPGTGKTDVAVQILSLIYHNFPSERTLIITHSNHALNDLFEKITKLDINERYLLRLGMGQRELETAQNFSRNGRVNYMLQRRLLLLEEVQKLSKSLDINIYPEFTCETADILYKYHIESRWTEYEKVVLNDSKNEVGVKFPFLQYLKVSHFLSNNDNNQENHEEGNGEVLAKRFFDFKDEQSDIERAHHYWQIVSNIFKELEECRAFEILRNNRERGNYLVSKQAKIIAMTCTHAALKRKDLLDTGFEYDNVLIEEAGQILEIETFIPLVLQKARFGKATKLKRIIMLGDHNQLPPIIKNNAFQKFSQMEQSMFNRLIRLKLPYDCLSHQGRCRPSILKLFGWRYPYLDNLPLVVPNSKNNEGSPYNFENAGFRHEFQFVNVPDFNNKGESAPMPHFYQNLAEAEYVVATYMYMVLLGYPAEKISILTTYNGQKFLIRDIINQKCSWNPIFKKPAKITTVDKYQGQQNDYVLLSLVRTENIGHLRDVRRLTVAMSRARFGLYVFGRFELFSGCHELRVPFKTFLEKPQKLQLTRGETYPTSRKVGEKANDEKNDIYVEDFQNMFKLVQDLLKQNS